MPYQKEKLQFLVMKNIMIKIIKLKEMVIIYQQYFFQTSKTSQNSLNLQSFHEYSATYSFQKIVTVINQYNQKYSSIFQTIWQNSQNSASTLQQDKKFDAVFDDNFIEFESFYIILQSFLRTNIRDLQNSLEESIQFPSANPEDLLQPQYENSVVLLDYLVTYFQLTALILDQFNEFEVFAEQSKIEQIAEGKPVKLTNGHFIEIKNKIFQLEI